MFQRHYSPTTFQTKSSPYFLPPLSCYAPVRCSSRLLLVASCNYQKLHFRQRTTSRTWTITIYFRHLFDCASRFTSCSPEWKPSLLESNILESNPLKHGNLEEATPPQDIQVISSSRSPYLWFPSQCRAWKNKRKQAFPSGVIWVVTRSLLTTVVASSVSFLRQASHDYWMLMYMTIYDS